MSASGAQPPLPAPNAAYCGCRTRARARDRIFADVVAAMAAPLRALLWVHGQYATASKFRSRKELGIRFQANPCRRKMVGDNGVGDAELPNAYGAATWGSPRQSGERRIPWARLSGERCRPGEFGRESSFFSLLDDPKYDEGLRLRLKGNTGINNARGSSGWERQGPIRSPKRGTAGFGQRRQAGEG